MKNIHVALVVICALAVSCAEPDSPRESAHRYKTELATRDVSLSLVAHFPNAKFHTGINRIDFKTNRDRRFLPSGWSRSIQETSIRSYANIGARNAVIEVPIVKPGPLTVRFLLAGLPRPDLLEKKSYQNIKVYLNGNGIGEITITSRARSNFEIPLPKKHQRVGINRLELRPRYWVDGGFSDFGEDRTIAAKCYEIKFVGEATRSVPKQTNPIVQDETIFQPVHSLVEMSLDLPASAHLKTTLALHGPEIDAIPAGRIELHARSASGKESTFSLGTLAKLKQSPHEVDINLKDHAGEMTTLTLVAAYEDPQAVDPKLANELAVGWRDPRIEGTRQVFADDGLDDLRGKYNVLVVLFDTLRADHTEPYDAAHARTPRLANLAERGVVFTNARSNAPWTLPSVASLMTSTHPWRHQCLKRGQALRGSAPTLAGTLTRNGYASIAVSGNGVFTPTHGFARDFQKFVEIYADYPRLRRVLDPRKRAEAVWNENIQPFLDRNESQPFYIQLHEIDPHSPYTPPPPYDTMYATGQINDMTNSADLMERVRDMRLSPADLENLQALYKGEVSFMDQYIGWILDHLDETGLTDNTIVIFLSDHGEEFLDHGQMLHGHTLFDELLRVPLIISLPGKLPQDESRHSPAALIDVTPTILDLLSIEAPAAMEGQSLLPDLAYSEDITIQRPLFAHGDFKFSVTYKGWKLIKHQATKSVDIDYSLQFRLYNIAKDPNEKYDLWAQEPVIVDTLHQMLLAKLRSKQIDDIEKRETIPLEDFPEEVRENLEALGYIE